MARSRTRSRSRSRSGKKYCIRASNGRRLCFQRGHSGFVKPPRRKSRSSSRSSRSPRRRRVRSGCRQEDGAYCVVASNGNKLWYKKGCQGFVRSPSDEYQMTHPCVGGVGGAEVFGMRVGEYTPDGTRLVYSVGKKVVPLEPKGEEYEESKKFLTGRVAAVREALEEGQRFNPLAASAIPSAPTEEEVTEVEYEIPPPPSMTV